MGEVYRARDTKLDRDVAIKVLREEFSQDKERLARFEREAKLLAQLNHSNIATLYGLEKHEGQQFLVMELVEGETLAERLAHGPMAVEEALPLFQHIAEGLEAAHEKGLSGEEAEVRELVVTPFNEYDPRLSPNGRWLAYTSDRTAAIRSTCDRSSQMEKRSRSPSAVEPSPAGQVRRVSCSSGATTA